MVTYDLVTVNSKKGILKELIILTIL